MPKRYADLKRELLEDPEFRAGYEALKLEFALVRAIIRARTSAGCGRRRPNSAFRC